MPYVLVPAHLVIRALLYSEQPVFFCFAHARGTSVSGSGAPTLDSYIFVSGLWYGESGHVVHAMSLEKSLHAVHGMTFSSHMIVILNNCMVKTVSVLP